LHFGHLDIPHVRRTVQRNFLVYARHDVATWSALARNGGLAGLRPASFTLPTAGVHDRQSFPNANARALCIATQKFLATEESSLISSRHHGKPPFYDPDPI
jgi:hypothetical protein